MEYLPLDWTFNVNYGTLDDYNYDNVLEYYSKCINFVNVLKWGGKRMKISLDI